MKESTGEGGASHLGLAHDLAGLVADVLARHAEGRDVESAAREVWIKKASSDFNCNELSDDDRLREARTIYSLGLRAVT